MFCFKYGIGKVPKFIREDRVFVSLTGFLGIRVYMLLIKNNEITSQASQNMEHFGLLSGRDSSDLENMGGKEEILLFFPLCVLKGA